MFTFSIGFSQEKLFKEIESYYDNGKPKKIKYLNTDLKTVVIKELNTKGQILTNFNFNPNTGIKDGDFEEYGTKGSYINGVLNLIL